LTGQVGNGGNFGSTTIEGQATFVAGYSMAGEIQWVEAASGGLSIGSDVAAQGDQIYFVGHFRDTVQLGFQSLTASSGSDILLARISSDQSTAAPTPWPTAVQLRTSTPNPFQTVTRLEYWLPSSDRARLTVHNLRGALVRVLMDRVRSPGEYAVRWDARDVYGSQVASGVYIIRLETAAGTSTLRVVRVR
jgi:FlgD Ig-like domain